MIVPDKYVYMLGVMRKKNDKISGRQNKKSPGGRPGGRNQGPEFGATMQKKSPKKA